MAVLLCGAMLIAGCTRKPAPSASFVSAPPNPIDALFQPWNHLDRPGVSVAVIDHGRLAYAKGFGSAQLEYRIPIEPDTIFHVASVSKQFTAMAIVLLEEDGKLSIDDDVHKYLPELPDYGVKITLHNLLNHTSGIRDQWQLLGLAGWSLQDVITQDQVLRLLFRQKELNFKPGTRMLYSNSGFTLLAEIVHRVSGEPFPKFCQERIFGPIGMTHSHFHLDLEEIVPNRAYSYDPGPHGGYLASPLNYATVGPSSLFTTASDLVKWLDNFRLGTVGGAAGIARMQEEGVLLNGTKIGYGLGIELGRYRGLRTLEHDGDDAGYRSSVVWFPDKEVGIAVLGNCSNCDTWGLARRVADLYLQDRPKANPPPKSTQPAAGNRAVAIDPSSFDRLAGSYELDDPPGFVLTYSREGNRYYCQAIGQPKLEIFPSGPLTFFYKVVSASVTFQVGPEGKIDRVVHHQGGVDHKGHRLAAAPPPSDFPEYAGVYWSEELQTEYTFSVRQGHLFGMQIRHGEFPVFPLAGDRFITNLWFAPDVKFERDSKKRIIAVTLGGGRVVGVRFIRRQ